MQLPKALKIEQEKIEAQAQAFGLDFFETRFVMVEWDRLNEIAAYGGFPTRYPHWRFGMHYESLIKGHEYGLSKIYELVINNDPCYAYLMASNDFVIQKLVMAHVYAHCDFFKNNFSFSQTRRNMIDVMANHATKIRQYYDKYGRERVERFIDTCLSLENLIDPYLPFQAPITKEDLVKENETTYVDIKRLDAKDYMQDYINPPKVLESQRLKALEEKRKKKQAIRFPENPQRDVLLFLLYYAPLRRWQREVLDIIREEAYYFAPQGMTKIMNEGWASYWHARIMTEKSLKGSEIIDFASLHSAVVQPNPQSLNPYKLGLELFRTIEERWDKGQHGPEWQACDDMTQRKHWDTGAMEGQSKIFEVRKLYNDITFIEEFFDQEFCSQSQLFTYQYNQHKENYEISSREFKTIKTQILSSLTNMGQPIIQVEDGNYRNTGDLLLVHQHTGVDLDARYVKATMSNLYQLWDRPVHLASKEENQEILYSFDGTELQKTSQQK